MMTWMRKFKAPDFKPAHTSEAHTDNHRITAWLNRLIGVKDKQNKEGKQNLNKLAITDIFTNQKCSWPQEVESDTFL